ncbi:MAG: diguanylate cyclase [Cyanobacteria bacterium J06635_1]
MSSYPRMYSKKAGRLFLQNLCIGVLYIVGIHLSVKLASLPGKVTAVWLPAGISLAAILWLGGRILPGVVLGSVAGNYQELIELPLSPLQIGVVEMAFAAAGCIEILSAFYLLRRFTAFHPQPIRVVFDQVRSTGIFILVVAFAPVLSATVGIAALVWAGLTPVEQIGISWLTWITGSSMAQILFTPPLILWPMKLRSSQTQLQTNSSTLRRSQLFPRLHPEVLLLFASVLGLCWLIFVQGYALEYVLFLPLIWMTCRWGSFLASWMVSLIAAISIFATAQGYGPFDTSSDHQSLILLQTFIGVCAVTVLVLGAVIKERHMAQSKLKQTLANLEQQIIERTYQLQQSEANLNSFFASAPVGMGIVDAQLRFVRVNKLLAEIDGVSEAVHIGQTLGKVLPDLAPIIEPLYRRVLATGEPLINQEVSGEVPSQPGKLRTWLVSYFSIQDYWPPKGGAIQPKSNIQPINKVGLMVFEISDRKRLEVKLQQQARLDGLTKISNRRCFDETLAEQWRCCAQAQQSLSLLLCDVDAFKSYNDTYGHLQGDQCLIRIAAIIQQMAQRASDLAARYGGEEFALLLPDTPLDGAVQLAQRIRATLADLKIEHGSSQISKQVTVSIGISGGIPNLTSPADQLILEADQALYQAKRQGRDRIVAQSLKR